MKQKLHKELSHDKIITAILEHFTLQLLRRDKDLFISALNRAYLIGFLDQPFDLETTEDGT